MRYGRWLLVSWLLFATPLLAAGQGGPSAKDAAPAPRGTLRVAVTTFDRESTALWLGQNAQIPYSGNMYDPLVASDHTGAFTRDGIATDWRFDATGKGFIVTIRPGVKFHNGDDFTADDLKFSLELHRNFPGAVENASGKFKAVVRSVDVLDRSRVRINLTSPDAIFINVLSWKEAAFGMLSKRYFESLPGDTLEKKSEAFVKAPMGSGPWKFVRRTIGSDIEFEANSKYWDRQRVPRFARLRVVKVPELSSRVNMLRTAEADIVAVDSEAAIRLAKQGFKIFINKNVAHATLMFYQCHDPKMITNNVRFRMAAIKAINREAIRDALFPAIPGAGSLASVPRGAALFGPGVSGYDPSGPTYTYDPEGARKLLKEIGYADNPVTITANAFSFSALPEGAKIMEMVVAFWNEVGIKARIRQVDWPFISRKILTWPQQFDAPGEVGIQAPFFRPSGLSNFLAFAASRNEYKTEAEKASGLEAGGALSSYCDLNKADRVYLDGVQTTDPAKFEEKMRALNKESFQDHWALNIVVRHDVWAARPGIVSDWSPVPLGPTYLRFETVKPGPEVR